MRIDKFSKKNGKSRILSYFFISKYLEELATKQGMFKSLLSNHLEELTTKRGIASCE